MRPPTANPTSPVESSEPEPSAPEAALVAGGKALPWGTGLVFLVAGVALLFPVVDSALIYDRSQILSGQIWRAWSGHVVHFGPSHFIWDMVVFLPAGVWLERLWPRRTRWLYFCCPWVLSMMFLAWEPSLEYYAGISGVATGVLVLLAGMQLLRSSSEPAWFWVTVLVLVAAKIGFEIVGGQPLMADLPGDVRVVSTAHIGGAVCALVVLFVELKRTVSLA